MPLTLYHSPAGNGKTDFLIGDAINRISTSPFGESFFWVGPGPKYLDWVQKKIIAESKARGHFWGNSFLTFERFLLTLLKQNLPRIHTATKSLSRHILRQILYHHPLWNKKSLFFKPVEQIRNTIITLKKNGVGFDDVLKIIPEKLKTDELKILCEVGEKYNQFLHELFFFDEGDLYKTTLDLLKEKKLALPKELSDIFFDRIFPLTPGRREIIKYLKNNFPKLNLYITHSFDFKKQDDPYFYPAYNALGELSDHIEFTENKKSAPKIFSSSFENQNIEIKNITLQIKNILQNKTEPGEIAVITPNPSYSEKLKNEFEKNSIQIGIKTALPLSIFKKDSGDNLIKTVTLFEKNKNLKLDATLKAQSAHFEFETDWNFETALVFKNIPDDILKKWKNDEINKTSFIYSESETGVATLSLQEGFALDFKNLFICGFNESAYPQFSDENPFITPELLTHPDLKEILWGPSFEAGLAKNFLEQAVLRSQTTTFSYSHTNENGNTQYPSRFLHLFACSPLTPLLSPPPMLSSSSQKLFPPAPLPDPISLTSLSDFNDCPFVYYSKNILKLPRKETDILGVAPDERGSFIHNILQYFYQQNPNVFEEKVSEEIWKKKLNQLVDSEKSKTGFFSKTSQAIASDFVEKALETITAFIEKELNDFWNGTKKTKPAYFEWSFGKGKTPALVLDTPNGKISVSGRIDRIDTNLENAQFSVIDYKTGEIDSGASLKRGESLQVPLYIMAVQNLLLKNEEPSLGALISLKEVGKKSALVFENSEEKKWASRQPVVTNQEWEELQTQIKKNVGDIAKKIKDGNFHPNPRQNSLCRRCDYREICDYENKG